MQYLQQHYANIKICYFHVSAKYLPEVNATSLQLVNMKSESVLLCHMTNLSAKSHGVSWILLKVCLWEALSTATPSLATGYEKFISSSLAHNSPFHQVSYKSIHTVLRSAANKQNKQTNGMRRTHNNNTVITYTALIHVAALSISYLADVQGLISFYPGWHVPIQWH